MSQTETSFFLAERQTSRRRAAASAVPPSEGGAWPVVMAILPLPAVGMEAPPYP